MQSYANLEAVVMETYHLYSVRFLILDSEIITSLLLLG